MDEMHRAGHSVGFPKNDVIIWQGLYHSKVRKTAECKACAVEGEGRVVESNPVSAAPLIRT
jgi:hypothetical protein